MDVSSQSTAPVAPAGALRMRPKADGTTLQLSYSGGAYFDLGGGGGGGTPGGSSTELQYRAGTSTFGAVTGSSVSGANLNLSGILTNGSTNKQIIDDPTLTDPTIRIVEYASTAAPAVLQFERHRGTSSSPSNLTGGDIAGRVDFQGRLSGSLQSLGYVEGAYDSTDGGFVRISSSTGRTFLAVTSQTDTITLQGFNGSTFNLFKVAPTGISMTPGASGSVYYKNASGYVAGVTIGSAGQVLTVADMGGGVLAPVWAAAGGSGSAPGGASGNLQYNNAGAFGGVSNSTVSGANLTLGGTVTLDDAGTANRQLVLSALSGSTNQLFTQRYENTATAITWRFERARGTAASPANLSVNDQVGTLDFYGRISGSMQKCGSLTSLYDTNALRAIRMYGPTSTIYVEASETDGAYLYNNGNLVQCTASAVKLSPGSSGSVYYRDSSGNLQGLAIGSAGSVLVSSGTLPAWATTFSDGVRLTFNPNGVNAGLNVGTHTADPSSPSNGDIYYNSSTGKFRVYQAATWADMVSSGGGTPGGSGTEIQYRSGASTFGAVTSSSVSGANITLGGNLIMASGTISFPDSVRQTFNPGTTQSGLNVGGNTTDPSSPVNGDIFYNSSSATFRFYQNGAWTTLGTVTPGGSGTELQYRASASTLGAVTNSSVSGSVITLGTSTGYTELQPSSIVVQGDVGASLSLRLHEASLPPIFSSHKSRGTAASKSAVQSGDTLYRADHYAYYSSSSLRTAGQTYFTSRSNWTSTEATAIFGVSTIHGTNVAPIERLVLGGLKTLTDNTLTDLFTITFGTTDHTAGGGELHLVFVAKQVSGSVQTHVYRRKMTFIMGHNGATNTSMFNMREDSGMQASAASDGGSGGGFNAISHAINSDSAVGISTAIPANPNVIATNTITYKILADSTLTTISQFTCYYHIVYHGEINITLA